MQKYIARVVYTFVFSILLNLIIFIAPALALDVDLGQQVTLKAKNSAGVPLHELPQPSFLGRAPDKATATVLDFDDQKHWIKIQLSDGKEGWIVERYVGNILTASPAGPPDNPVVVVDDIFQPTPVATSGSVILPGQSGDQLLEQLRTIYSTTGSVSYDDARDLLYSQIDNKAGIVEGLYSGYRAQIPQNSSHPRDDASTGGINAEHVWPRSYEAEGKAFSDMHHIFPTKTNVNISRQNYPFAEIPDDQTKYWYLDDRQESEKPSSKVIDQYSELRKGAFEPRESKKGDVARAMFYFRTIYPDRADDFFNSQKDTLCKWAKEDPIDAGEVERSHKIAKTRQGNENPFILDPTLPKRTYCN